MWFVIGHRCGGPRVTSRRPHTWLRLTPLQRRDTPSRPLPYPVIYTGAETGAPPAVKAFDADTGAVLFERQV